MTLVAAVDIGGTKTAVGLVDGEGVLLRRVTTPTPAASGPTAVLGTVVRAVRTLSEEAGRLPVSVGVGSAGVIDAAKGRVTSATDALTDWAGTPLRAELERQLGLPVAVDNDVHAHAIGEAWLGAAHGRREVLLVAAGTGIGGSLLIEGRVHHGAHGVAGHVGHLPVPAAEGRPCSCGGFSHAEAVASGPALLAAYREQARATGESPLGPEAGLAEVAARAEGGEKLALAVLAVGATALGQAVGGLANVVDPEVVLVSGGVSQCGDTWWGPLRAAIRAELLPPLVELPVVKGQLGGDAALYGAARLALSVTPATATPTTSAPASPASTVRRG